MISTLYVVIPCYNEQEVLPETACCMKNLMNDLIETNKINNKSKIVFINDGSVDHTWNIIQNLHNSDKIFSGIKLSCNKGHQNALFAGVMAVKNFADVVITMDADLQDDIHAIEKMLDKYQEGCDIVYGVRSNRKKDTFFKRATAEAYYRIMNLFGAKTIFNHADYRLMSKRAIDALEKFDEVNLFLRGIIPLIGFQSDIVYYDRNERVAGKSKYPFGKMCALAMEGITSFSIKPIRIISAFGALIFTFSIAMLIYILIRYFSGETIIGWASVAISVWGIGGLILLSLGIIGEYIGKIYMEVKRRPRFFIENMINDVEQDEKVNDEKVNVVSFKRSI